MSQIGRTLGSGRGRASAPPVDGAWARDGGGLGYLAAFSFWQLHSKNATPVGLSSTQRRPRCMETICLAIVRPNPDPFTPWLPARSNRLKILSLFSSEIP